MVSKKRVLVFPCGSEIGLELHRSLRYSRHFDLIGASSVEDNGELVFDDYIGGAPLLSDEDFESWLCDIVERHNIDLIFPAMDKVLVYIKKMEPNLSAKVVGHPLEVCQICSSKIATYEYLTDSNIVPMWTNNLADVYSFPVFAKPDVGYGSRGALLLNDMEQAKSAKTKLDSENYVYCEYLPGEEYTVDCFTDRHGALRFVGPRPRSRVVNGISVRTETMVASAEFLEVVDEISKKFAFRGAWFCQLKRDKRGSLKLLEVAARFGGSSSLYRVKGVNFALLTLFDCLDCDVSININDIHVFQERSLDIKYKSDIKFEHVYVDYDDCLIFDDRFNYKLMSLLYKFKDESKYIYLISRHKFDLKDAVGRQFPPNFFDKVIHIVDESPKSAHIHYFPAIFIDDSYIERQDVADKLNIAVFSPDALDLFCVS